MFLRLRPKHTKSFSNVELCVFTQQHSPTEITRNNTLLSSLCMKNLRGKRPLALPNDYLSLVVEKEFLREKISRPDLQGREN